MKPWTARGAGVVRESRAASATGEKFSRPPWERMMRMHRLIQSGKYPNCRKLADELEVCAKTIQRDIDFMRYRLQLPIEYDQLKFGFHYTEPVAGFPAMEMTEGELVALLIAEKALAQHRGTIFEKPLRSACQRLAEGLHDRVTVDWAALDQAISFRSAGVAAPELAVFDAVSRAVVDSVEISFQYLKLRSTQHEFRRARPYHLGCVENQWYVFGHDLDRGQMRTFALPRMRSLKVTKRRFERPADFSIAKHLAESFGVFATGGATKLQRIVVRFDAFAARLVAERTWHPTQQIRALAAGEIELSMQLSGLEEIERWVLSWGGHARVIAPKALREKIEEAAQQILQAMRES
jgi:predicted DNA-binding transcriptional regulator YafY